MSKNWINTYSRTLSKITRWNEKKVLKCDTLCMNVFFSRPSCVHVWNVRITIRCNTWVVHLFLGFHRFLKTPSIFKDYVKSEWEEITSSPPSPNDGGKNKGVHSRARAHTHSEVLALRKRTLRVFMYELKITTAAAATDALTATDGKRRTEQENAAYTWRAMRRPQVGRRWEYEENSCSIDRSRAHYTRLALLSPPPSLARSLSLSRTIIFSCDNTRWPTTTPADIPSSHRRRQVNRLRGGFFFWGGGVHKIGSMSFRRT